MTNPIIDIPIEIASAVIDLINARMQSQEGKFTEAEFNEIIYRTSLAISSSLLVNLIYVSDNRPMVHEFLMHYSLHIHEGVMQAINNLDARNTDEERDTH